MRGAGRGGRGGGVGGSDHEYNISIPVLRWFTTPVQKPTAVGNLKGGNSAARRLRTHRWYRPRAVSLARPLPRLALPSPSSPAPASACLCCALSSPPFPCRLLYHPFVFRVWFVSFFFFSFPLVFCTFSNSFPFILLLLFHPSFYFFSIHFVLVLFLSFFLCFISIPFLFVLFYSYLCAFYFLCPTSIFYSIPLLSLFFLFLWSLLHHSVFSILQTISFLRFLFHLFLALSLLPSPSPFYFLTRFLFTPLFHTVESLLSPPQFFLFTIFHAAPIPFHSILFCSYLPPFSSRLVLSRPSASPQYCPLCVCRCLCCIVSCVPLRVVGGGGVVQGSSLSL